MFSVPINPPSSWTDPLVMPVILTFFGLLVFGLGIKKEMDGGKAMWKWMGIALTLLAAMIGFTWFNACFGSSPDSAFYQASLIGNRMRFAHGAAFVLPLIGALAGIITNFVVAARIKREEAYS